MKPKPKQPRPLRAWAEIGDDHRIYPWRIWQNEASAKFRGRKAIPVIIRPIPKVRKK